MKQSFTYLCLDGTETGGTVGPLAPQTLEAFSAPTATQIITLSGLRALKVTITRWFPKQERKQMLITITVQQAKHQAESLGFTGHQSRDIKVVTSYKQLYSKSIY